MGQWEQFIGNHWQLWLALVVVLILILINEFLSQKKKAQELSPQATVLAINHDNAIILDLRDAQAFNQGHIVDAIRVSEADFSQPKMNKYKDKAFILVCARGLQSLSLAAKLKKQGFLKPKVLTGGMTAWQAAGLPTVKGK